DNVLDPDRHAVQGAAAPASLQLGVTIGGLAARSLGIDQHPRLNAIFELIDAGQAPVDELARSEPSGSQLLAGFVDGGNQGSVHRSVPAGKFWWARSGLAHCNAHEQRRATG